MARWTIALGVVSLLAWRGERAAGCSPMFPNSALDGGDKALLAAPRADFGVEMQRLFPRTTLVAVPAGAYHTVYGQEQSDAADVAEILAATGDKPLAGKVEAWRNELHKQEFGGKLTGNPGDPPAGLPPEFALYERGALAYRNADLPAARAQWQKVLDLPERDRPHRTLWAYYMIGRSLVDFDPARAADMLGRVRHLAKPEGAFTDSLGLAVASLGWQARALWNTHQPVPAMHLYLEQASAGDVFATESLRECARMLLDGDEATLRMAAADSIACRTITAYLAANGGRYNHWNRTADHLQKTARFLNIVQALDLKDVPGAERLAWAAYQAGDFKAAEHWLAAGGKPARETPVGQWIQAKLYLRTGQVDKAAACLANAARSFPVEEDWTANIEDGDDSWRPAWHAAGELAALKLGRGQYAESLDLLFKSEFWWDAAYVAEWVLTVDELKAYVDKHWPAADAAKSLTIPKVNDEDLIAPYEHRPDAGELRELLGRRLTRSGRWKEARAYFSAEHQKLLDTYVAGIRVGHDAKRPALERGQSLFAAAKVARDHGMELLATAWGPDAQLVGGDYEFKSGVESRVQERAQGNEQLAPSLPDEIQRVREAAPNPDKRFHYRYVAADLAWDAAKLMPDNSDELAEMLIEAGGWLKHRDPKAADRFYKALVKRCGETTRGRAAAELHWFPPSPPAATRPAAMPR